jgi:hypothetical protein
MSKQPILCHNKRIVHIGFCRYWIPKVAGVAVEDHHCASCGRVRVVNPWSSIKEAVLPGLKDALEKATNKPKTTENQK